MEDFLAGNSDIDGPALSAAPSQAGEPLSQGAAAASSSAQTHAGSLSRTSSATCPPTPTHSGDNRGAPSFPHSPTQSGGNVGQAAGPGNASAGAAPAARENNLPAPADNGVPPCSPTQPGGNTGQAPGPGCTSASAPVAPKTKCAEMGAKEKRLAWVAAVECTTKLHGDLGTLMK